MNTITGPIDIETSFKDVIVNEFAGACKVTNEHADVKLSSWERLNGDVTVKNRTGDIEVFLAKKVWLPNRCHCPKRQSGFGFPPESRQRFPAIPDP